ncbi:MAG TPA: AAA family ATPase, partial [Tissierellaceae bacterium]
MLENNQFIRQIELDRKRVESFEKYPFSLPVIRGLSILDLHPKVTFIVGENGTGKSTILEAVAAACGFNPEGGTRNFHFSSRASHSELYNYIRII